ncbi:Uncharacterised protein [Vibrio cholerae]|nr:Uncharacterised protein [Vibrio cholerae]CSI04924.1 Uncharacterised protein [Vibrio cholerae]
MILGNRLPIDIVVDGNPAYGVITITQNQHGIPALSHYLSDGVQRHIFHHHQSALFIG